MRWGVSRYTLAGALLAAVIVGALVLILGSGSSTRARGHAAAHSTVSGERSAVIGPTGAASAGPRSATALGDGGHGRSARHGAQGVLSGVGAGTAGGGAAANHAAGRPAVAVGPAGGATVAEVRDPEEARSFPLPHSVRHKSATAPRVAGEAAIAAGAASDAEIRKELSEEQHAKAQEQAAARRAFTPAATSGSEGGSSVGGDGTIPIPTNVPEAVQRVIAGGNAIADFPYIWGGGHGSFVDKGYDCSGSVSYALAAGGLLRSPLVSGDLANWGDPGPGRWITIYANAGHTFMYVDGAWFDTAGRSGPYASRWITATPSLAGYAVRHPPGF